MKIRRMSWSHFLLLLASAGLSVFLNTVLQSRTYTILNHGFRLKGFSLPALLLCWAGFFILLTAGVKIVARKEVKAFGADYSERRREGTLASVPFLFFLLSPLLLAHYITKADVRLRLSLLAVFVALAVFGLKFAGLFPFLKESLHFVKKWQTRFIGLSLRKKLVILFIAAFLIYNLCAFVLVSQGITFSGDEPNYLLTAHSLLYDRDINLANNYADKDYFHFYSREDNPRLNLGIYGQYGKKGKDYIYPINLPGISALMLPWYWASQFLNGRWLTFILKGSLSVWAVLLGLQVYLLARDLWRKENPAFILWLFYSFSSPVLFYAVHLYPEIPIALFSVYIFRKVRSTAPLSSGRLLFMGFLLATFFWFGLKYHLIFWPLLFVSLYFLLKQHKARAKILAFLAFPVLGLVLFYYFLFSLYGTISPIAVYEGTMTPERSQALKEAVLGIPLWARTDAFFDYFLDQRDGLLLYAPLYLFMFLGLTELFRRSKKDVIALLLIALPFLVNYAFFTHRQGHCPQARVLTPLSWIGALLIGTFLAFNKNRLFSLLFWAAGLASLGIAGILLFHPSFLYQPTTHEFTERAGDLFVFLSNWSFFLPSFLPSFIKVRNLAYLPNYLWIAAVLLFMLFYVIFREKRRGEFGMGFHVILAALLLGASFALWVYYPRTVLYPTLTFTYSSQKTLGFYPFPIGKNVVAKAEGALYLHDDRTYTIVFSSRKKLEQVKLVFGSEAGEHEVKAKLFDLPLYEGRTVREKKELIFTPSACIPLRRLYIYEIEFGFKKRSNENLKVDPCLLQIIPLQ